MGRGGMPDVPHSLGCKATYLLRGISSSFINFTLGVSNVILDGVDGWLRMGLLPPLGNFADISYLVEN